MKTTGPPLTRLEWADLGRSFREAEAALLRVGEAMFIVFPRGNSGRWFSISRRLDGLRSRLAEAVREQLGDDRASEVLYRKPGATGPERPSHLWPTPRGDHKRRLDASEWDAVEDDLATLRERLVAIATSVEGFASDVEARAVLKIIDKVDALAEQLSGVARRDRDEINGRSAA